MKKWILFSCICIVSINSAYSQKYRKQQFTLFKYNCIVDQNIIDKLKPLEDQMECKAPKAYSKVEMLFVQDVYATVKKKMEDKYGVFILPINSFGDKISYNDFGFPDILINTAIKKGNSKYYFKINASIQQSSKLESQTSDELWPVVKIQIDLFNKDGYQPIKSTQGISEAVGVMKKEPFILQGMECAKMQDKITTQTEIIQTLINDAVESALKKL